MHPFKSNSLVVRVLRLFLCRFGRVSWDTYRSQVARRLLQDSVALHSRQAPASVPPLTVHATRFLRRGNAVYVGAINNAVHICLNYSFSTLNPFSPQIYDLRKAEQT